MKIAKKNKQSSKKIIVTIALIIAALLVVLVVYLVVLKGSLLGWQPFGTPTTTSPTTQSSSDTSHGTKDDTTTDGTDKTTDQIPVSDTLTATITTLSQADGMVTFKGSANDSSAGGSCSIVFSNSNDRPISRTVKTTVSGNTATCETVQIPESEFSYLGEWTATFRYYSADTQAVTESKITIQ